MSLARPLLIAALAAGCSGKTGPGAGPSSGATPADAPAPAAPDGAKKLHLIFTGNVHGEIEPCG